MVVVIGSGAGLFFFGDWLTLRGEGPTGWVAYAPLSTAVNGAGPPGIVLHPWVRLVVWLALITVWVVVGVVLLRSRPAEDLIGSDD